MNKHFYQIMGRLLTQTATPAHYKENAEKVDSIMKIRRLAKKHHRLAEMDCNGEGWIKGTFYRLDGNYTGAYVKDDVSIFTAESDKIEEKIQALAAEVGLRAEFQGDPRGATVKLFYGQTDLTCLLWD